MTGIVEKTQKTLLEKMNQKEEEIKTMKNQAQLVEQSLEKDRELKARELKDANENLKKFKAELAKIKSELGISKE